MAQAQAVASFAISAGSTSAVAIDLTGKWSDGGSWTPHAYLIFYRNGTVNSTGTGDCFWGRGMSDGTAHWCHAGATADGVVASSAGQFHASNAVLVECDVEGVLTGQVDHTSVAADTITVTPSNALTNTISGFVVAFYDTAGAKVRAEAMPNATGSFSKTGVGFRGSAAIFMSALDTVINTGADFLRSALGIATSSSAQALLMTRVRENATADYTLGQINTGAVIGQGTTLGAALTNVIQFTSFDADGYTCNRVDGTTQHLYGVLVLGSPAVVVTSTHQTSVTTWAVSVAGITPTGVLAMAENPQTASQSVSTEGMHNAIGAATAFSQCSIELNGHPNDTLNPAVTEEYSRSTNNKLLTHYDRTGADAFTAVGEIEKSAFADQQLVLSQTDANTAAVLIALLVFGDPSLVFYGHGRRRRDDVRLRR